MEQQLTEEQILEKRKQLLKLLEFGSDKLTDELVEKQVAIFSDTEKSNRVFKEIKFLDNPCSYSVIKRVIREQYGEDGSLRFFINKNKIIRGKITNKIEEGIVEIPLIEKYEKTYYTRLGKQLEIGLCIFGDKRNTKEAIITDCLTAKFHMYRIIVRENEALQTYTLLSRTPLEIGEYEVIGMALELEDYSEISKYTRLAKKSSILFVNETRPCKITFSSKEQFIDKIKECGINEDSFFENFLSIELGGKYLYFQHPRYFERLVAAFFTSAKFDSSPYPLHLVVIGKQGGGKSKAMEAMSEKIDETIPIVEGSGSTMKSLIPSFKGDLTKPGALIESNRIVFIDEFFRILMRVDKDDRENTLTHLNPLLEHKKRRFGSGNNFLDAQMTSKLFAVTNPVFGTSNMEHLVNKLDNSFISRTLIWYQDENHYNEVINKKESELKQVDIKISKELWKAIFDFSTSFKAEFDVEECNKIHLDGLFALGSLSEGIREIYKTRYKHHLYCLLDGIIKLRCICSGDPNFKANSDDFLKTREIWLKMIENWKTGLENVRYEIREGRFY